MSTERPYRLAIVGSRDWPRLEEVCFYVLRVWKKDPTVEVVSGGALGVDSTAVETAKALGLPIKEFRPQWNNADGTYNPRAGFERNLEIVQYADEVTAFWYNESRGTADTLRHVQRLQKPNTVFTRLEK